MGTQPPARTAEGDEPASASSEPAADRAPEPAAAAGAEADERRPDPTLDTLRTLEAELAPYFPVPFDETELVLMDVDPRRIHAYWHVCPDDLEAAGAGAAPAPPLVLRVYDVTDSGADGPGDEFFDVDIQGLESRCYVDLWQPGRVYEAELALRSAGGALQTMARSNRVQTPREQPDTALQAPERPPSAPIDVPPLSASRTDDAARATLRQAAADEAAFPSAARVVVPDRVTDAVAPPEGFASEPEGGACRTDEAERGGELAAAPPPASPMGSGPPGDLPPLAPGVEGETVEPALCEPPSALSREFPNAAPEEGRPEDSLAADYAEAVDGATLPPPGDRIARGHEAPPGEAAGVPLVTFSSSSLAGSESVLEVHAELHVFGRARPGSRLRIFGRPVALRPDGSFSVRRPLPAGAVVLPLDLEEPESGAAPSPEGP
jgi:hypothetical protein